MSARAGTSLLTIAAILGLGWFFLEGKKARAQAPTEPERLPAGPPADALERQAALAAVQAFASPKPITPKPKPKPKPTTAQVVPIRPQLPTERFGSYTVIPTEKPSKPAKKAAKQAKPAVKKASPATAPAAVKAPSDPTNPNGFDPVLARRLAPSLASYLKRTQHSADRARVKQFQRAAGLPIVDGLYGGTTRGALIYYGATNAPKALYAPVQTVPYQAPQMG